MRKSSGMKLEDDMEELLDEISIYIFWGICGGLVGFMVGLY